ncbi:MAG: MBL fold metallo-hydrolase, partial [Firmicutes bacterium]|nr:MBL fold metallo-hydrolase [Bacillota bacterium]
MESTYGGRLHPENSTSIDRLIHIIRDTVKRGGSVIIPAFAVGRTQELIYELNMFYEHHPEYRDFLEDLNVYIDSPMATTATEVFRKNAQVFDEETKELILSGDNPLDFKNLIFTRSTAESQALNMNRVPKIIISASGMCEAGRIRHHLKHNLWDPKNSIVFVGYQAEGTLGRALIDGVKEVKLFGETVIVAAEIHNLEGFSGHADQNGLLDWLGGFQKIPRQIFLVHGEEQSKIDFAKAVQERLGLSTTPVFANSEFELETGELIAKDEVIKEVIDEEGLTNLRSKIQDIQKGVDNILSQTDNALAKEDISADKLTQINNILQELEKVSLNLGSTVTKG